MRTSRMILLLGLLTMGTAVAGSLEGSYNRRNVRSTRDYYTIRVASFTEMEWDVGIGLVDSLKTAGCFTFYERHKNRNDSAAVYDVYIGCHDTPADARQYAASLEYHGPVGEIVQREFVAVANDTLAIIQMPQAIWLRQDNTFTELIKFPKRHAGCDNDYTQPFLAPRGDEVLFEFNCRIYAIDLICQDQNEIEGYQGKYVFEGSVMNSFPQRSPSGKYIAYIPNNMWESWSGLCLISQSDSPSVLLDSYRPLGEKTPPLGVKNFRWHPREDLIFCVMGYGGGTVAVGGDIYGVDLAGNCRLLISCDKNNREEITLNISVARDTLFYELATWDEPRCYFTKLEKKKANVDDLLNKFYNRTIK